MRGRGYLGHVVLERHCESTQLHLGYGSSIPFPERNGVGLLYSPRRPSLLAQQAPPVLPFHDVDGADLKLVVVLRGFGAEKEVRPRVRKRREE